MREYRSSIDVSDELARVLTNPLRNRLLSEYGFEPTSPSKVARRLGESLSLVSYHTRILLAKSCLELVRTERRRGATEHYYRARVAAALEDGAWDRTPVAARRALVHGTLGAATDDARRAALAGGFDGARAHLSRMLLRLDDRALDAVAGVLREAVDQVGEIGAESRAREPEGRSYELVMLCFERESAP